MEYCKASRKKKYKYFECLGQKCLITKMFYEKISPGLKYLGLLGIITVIAVKDIFFELFFILWILRNLYLWKTTFEYESHNRDFTSKEFYGKTKQHEKNVFGKIEKGRTMNNEELRDILTETGNLQRIMFEDFIKRLNMEKVENIAKVQEFLEEMMKIRQNG